VLFYLKVSSVVIGIRFEIFIASFKVVKY
jgi:hypothetical protein